MANRFNVVQESKWQPAPYQEVLAGNMMKQQKHDLALQAESELLQSIANIKAASPQHQLRLDEITASYQEEINGIYNTYGYDKSQALGSLKALQNKFITDLTSGDLGIIDRSYKTYSKESEEATKMKGEKDGGWGYYTPFFNTARNNFNQSGGVGPNGELVEYTGGSWERTYSADEYYTPLFKNLKANVTSTIENLIQNGGDEATIKSKIKELSIQEIYQEAGRQQQNIHTQGAVGAGLYKQHMFDLGNMGDERLAMMAMNAYNNMYTDPMSGNLSPNAPGGASFEDALQHYMNMDETTGDGQNRAGAFIQQYAMIDHIAQYGLDFAFSENIVSPYKNNNSSSITKSHTFDHLTDDPTPFLPIDKGVIYTSDNVNTYGDYNGLKKQHQETYTSQLDTYNPEIEGTLSNLNSYTHVPDQDFMQNLILLDLLEQFPEVQPYDWTFSYKQDTDGVYYDINGNVIMAPDPNAELGIAPLKGDPHMDDITGSNEAVAYEFSTTYDAEQPLSLEEKALWDGLKTLARLTSGTFVNSEGQLVDMSPHISTTIENYREWYNSYRTAKTINDNAIEATNNIHGDGAVTQTRDNQGILHTTIDGVNGDVSNLQDHPMFDQYVSAILRDLNYDLDAGVGIDIDPNHVNRLFTNVEDQKAFQEAANVTMMESWWEFTKHLAKNAWWGAGIGGQAVIDILGFITGTDYDGYSVVPTRADVTGPNQISAEEIQEIYEGYSLMDEIKTDARGGGWDQVRAGINMLIESNVNTDQQINEWVEDILYDAMHEVSPVLGEYDKQLDKFTKMTMDKNQYSSVTFALTPSAGAIGADLGKSESQEIGSQVTAANQINAVINGNLASFTYRDMLRGTDLTHQFKPKGDVGELENGGIVVTSFGVYDPETQLPFITALVGQYDDVEAGKSFKKNSDYNEVIITGTAVTEFVHRQFKENGFTDLNVIKTVDRRFNAGEREVVFGDALSLLQLGIIHTPTDAELPAVKTLLSSGGIKFVKELNPEGGYSIQLYVGNNKGQWNNYGSYGNVADAVLGNDTNAGLWGALQMVVLASGGESYGSNNTEEVLNSYSDVTRGLQDFTRFHSITEANPVTNPGVGLTYDKVHSSVNTAFSELTPLFKTRFPSAILKIESAFRDKKLNDDAGGHEHSGHLKGMAIDISNVTNLSGNRHADLREVYDFLMSDALKDWREKHNISVIDEIKSKNHIHIGFGGEL